MSVVRGVPLLVLVAVMACASQAERAARSATIGVKSKIAEIDPVVARTIGDQAARGAVTGALDKLASEEQRELVGAIVETTSKAATRGIVVALRPDAAHLQELVDSAVTHALDGVSRHLAADSGLREQLAATTHRISASAVYGARDALADIFPACTHVPDRRRCVEDQLGEVSRTAARGMVAGAIDASRWPILVLVFMAGALAALLVVRVRR